MGGNISISCNPASGDARKEKPGCEHTEGNGMNWYVLVDGRLVHIGHCGDWDAAYEIAADLFPDECWTWLASQHDVDQWVQCITETERGS